jgi:DNA-binding transcriptional MerR regulator
MDNNLFSLFDDVPENEEINEKEKKSKGNKKKPVAQVQASSLFLFEEDTNQKDAENNDNTKSENKFEDENVGSANNNINNATLEIINLDNIVEESFDSTVNYKDLSEDDTINDITEPLVEDLRDETSETQVEEIQEKDKGEEVEKASDFLFDEHTFSEEVSNEDQINFDSETNEAPIINNLDELKEIKEEEEEEEEELNALFAQEIIQNDYAVHFIEKNESFEHNIISNKTTLPEEEISNAVEEKSLLEALETDVASLPEWNLNKKYYTIGEVAKLFEVNTSHIRFWSKEFDFKLRTTRKGDRMYTVEDIDKLRLIHELVKVKKHTIKGAKELLSTNKKKVVEKVDLKAQLKDLKSLLLGIQNKL